MALFQVGDGRGDLGERVAPVDLRSQLAALNQHPGRAPEGINISRIGPTDDALAIHAVLSEAFAKEWSPHLGSFDRWVEEQSSTPSYDPSLWLLAKDGTELVGVLTANTWGDRGCVSHLGVLAHYRRRGIGAALLRHSFATFASRGVRRIVLNVDTDNPTGATTLYEHVGMRVGKRWDMWERSSEGSRQSRLAFNDDS